MLGAITGDIIVSVYEFNNLKCKDFTLFDKKCRFTDDTVMTCAVAKSLKSWVGVKSDELFTEALINNMKQLGREYPYAGYGGMFSQWLTSDTREPYNSFGNGSAMRVSPVAWVAEGLEEAERLARLTAIVTHNHPEGVKGAQAIAGATYLAAEGATKAHIRDYIVKEYYPLNRTLDEIRLTYKFDATCQGSVPQAITAFLESTDFEDAIRNAVSIGGDSDTIAAMCGAVAEAFYGIPDEIYDTALSFLDNDLLDIYDEFQSIL